MKNSGNTLKLVLAIVLLIALAAVITMQFAKVLKKPAETPPPPITAAQEKAAPPAGETPVAGAPEAGKPVEGAKPVEPGKVAPPAAQKPEAAKTEAKAPPTEPKPEAKAPVVGKPAPMAGKPPEGTKPPEAGKPAAPPAQTPVEEELPKISFMNEKVDKAFTNSRFFAVNHLVPAGNPFRPMGMPVPPRPSPGAAKLMKPGMPGSPFIPPSGNVGEVPMLPMPNEILGEPIRVTLLGISQSGDTSTALFSVGSEKSATNVMAHPGWLVGNDYIFVGAENGKAKVFNRKTNRVIQLATGETI